MSSDQKIGEPVDEFVVNGKKRNAKQQLDAALHEFNTKLIAAEVLGVKPKRQITEGGLVELIYE